MAKGNFGERLKREREMREISFDELSKSTRISPRFLGALENEDWEKLPGGVFGHGFVRTIARYLGLDEEALLAEYDLARADKLPPPPPRPEERIPAPPKWIPAVAVLGILLLLFGLFFAGRYGWRRWAAHRASRNAAAAQSPTNAVPGSLGAFSALVSARAHVRILGHDKLLLDSGLPAVKLRASPPQQPLDVSASDSAAVLLELNGRA